jgi:hypothetical protein
MEGMDALAVESGTSAEAPQPGRFRIEQLAYWLPACAAIGLAMAYAADVAQKYYTPFLLFPLMVGAVLGGLLVGLLRAAQVGHRATVLCGALLACTVAAGGQHYVRYWRVREAWREGVERNPQKFFSLNDPSLREAAADMVPPEQFWAFLQWSASQGLPVGSWKARDEAVWVIWGLDAGLVFIPAIFLVWTTVRLPYCNRCGRWFHATRGGRIDADTARQLATVVNGTAVVDVAADPVRKARYRLIGCPSGCGPIGLSLSWEQRDGNCSAGPIWLSASQRDRVAQVLDAAIAKREEVASENQHTHKDASEDPTPGQPGRYTVPRPLNPDP